MPLIVLLFVACHVSSNSSLEDRAKLFLDSLITDAKSQQQNQGNAVTRTMKYIETTYSDDSLCVMNYSMYFDGKVHTYEFIFTYPQKHNITETAIYYWGHPIDTVLEKDHLHGVSVSKLFNLDSEEAKREIRSMEDYRRIPN